MFTYSLYFISSTMKKSNIFVYTELSKLANGLSTDAAMAKQRLKSLAGYFNIITSKYFSEALIPEWEEIVLYVKQKGPGYDFEGKILCNAVHNTLDQMPEQQCVSIAERIITLHQKVKSEFEQK